MAPDPREKSVVSEMFFVATCLPRTKNHFGTPLMMAPRTIFGRPRESGHPQAWLNSKEA